MNRRIATWAAVAAILALFSANAYAGGMTVGAKLGANIANLRGEFMSDEVSAKTGAVLGGFFSFAVNDVFAIQPEVLVFSEKGAKEDFVVGSQIVEFKLVHDYLEIPVLVKAMIPVEGTVKPSVFAGPALGLKLRAKARAESGTMAAEMDLDELGIELKSTDFGLTFGGGVGIDRGKSVIVIDGRYTMGLTDIWEIDLEDGTTYEPEVKNGVFSITVGYGLTFE
jgi:hypothetical protein